MKKVFLVGVFCFISLAAFAQQALQKYLDDLGTTIALQNAAVSICVKDGKTGQTLASLNPKLSLSPASVTKIFTTAAALHYLGDKYTFKTQLQHDGKVENGVLKGNLWIKGGGDPTLGSQYLGLNKDSIFMNWYRALVALNIEKIEGVVIGNASVFENGMASPFWLWSDLGNYYGAGASGLTFQDNTVSIPFLLGKNQGDSTAIVKSAMPYYFPRYINEVSAGKPKSGDNAYVYGVEYNPFWFINGTIGAGDSIYAIKASHYFPALYAAGDLRAFLEQKGIKFVPQSKESVDSFMVKENYRWLLEPSSFDTARIFITDYQSPNLASIINIINKNSNNLYAECVSKAISLEKNKNKGYRWQANELVQQYLVKKGMDSNGVFIMDGCGMARGNAVSSENIATFLYQIQTEKYFKTFYASLPEAGVSGTLANFGKGSVIHKKLKAKSGTMTRVKAYAGYLTVANGEQIVVSMVFNNYACSAKEITAICVEVAKQIAVNYNK